MDTIRVIFKAIIEIYSIHRLPPYPSSSSLFFFSLSLTRLPEAYILGRERNQCSLLVALATMESLGECKTSLKLWSPLLSAEAENHYDL